MRPIQPGELARMNRSLETALPQSATVTQKGQPTQNALGETVTPTVTFTMDCLIKPQGYTSKEGNVGPQVQAITQWVLNYPLSVTLHATDKLLIDGVRYEVSSVKDHQGFEIIRRAVCTRLGS